MILHQRRWRPLDVQFPSRTPESAFLSAFLQPKFDPEPPDRRTADSLSPGIHDVNIILFVKSQILLNENRHELWRVISASVQKLDPVIDDLPVGGGPDPEAPVTADYINLIPIELPFSIFRNPPVAR